MEHVYRVQHIDGYGPYRFGGLDRWAESMHSSENGRPGPYEDNGISDIWFDLQNKDQHYDFSFGFASLDQLHAWFTPTELQTLQGLGYNVISIPIQDVEEVFHGQKQVIFKMKRKAA